ncbi:hypothetical protein [Hominisplanchenecus murintestinalis]|uniref:hypothetical protein n=1 Tax=Hominisplanchenecus murintestinalis TaxID=2941517 RepID=UPI00203CBB7D|nr:hypothetical protein [Hominisplanchenecus murintestinalis]
MSITLDGHGTDSIHAYSVRVGYAAGFPAYGVNMGTIGSVTFRSKHRNYRFRNCLV